jgi:NADH-quinone oxidoreductase subunit J
MVPLIFYFFASLLVLSATMVIVSKQPVYSVLYLVFSFFCSAVLWLLIQAEFLALVLLFVYVGAVMTLFLFVVMMLNLDLSKMREQFVRYLPIGILVLLAFVGVMVFLVLPQGQVMTQNISQAGSELSNTALIGQLLYTEHLYPFEIAGLILLVAMVAAISLAFHGRKPGTKTQKITEQHQATKSSRLRLVNLKEEQS